MSSEVRVVGSLALLYVFRMLGLFMILPIFVLYGAEYDGASPFLLGLALGIYGLTQAIFQIPLGLLSDLFGRKTIIVLGLVVFAVGSVVAAVSTSIEGVIIGRALQGSGAIASAIMAMVADLTSEENRTKAMAAIGASIGVSFTLAMILGPLIASFAGLGGIFAFSAILALLGILIVIFLVPTPHRSRTHGEAGAIPRFMLETLKNKQLLRLDYGIFALHAVLMAMFVAIPSVLEAQVDLARDDHWVVYLPVLVISFVFMVPLMIVSEKKRQVKTVFLFSIFLLFISTLAQVSLSGSVVAVIGALFVFFVAFNFLEATLPSWVSKVSPAGTKGTAMGIYSTSQFIGAFVGGTLGGWLLNEFGNAHVFYFCLLLLGSWFVMAIFMAPPKYLQSLCFNVDDHFNAIDKVLALKGVEEAKHVIEESLLYLKVDKRYFNELDAQKLVSSE